MRHFLILAALAATPLWTAPAAAEIKTVTCGSDRGDENVCKLPKRTNQVVVSRQLSGKACDRGRSWDVRKVSGHDELWVRNGCRAEFAVRYDK